MTPTEVISILKARGVELWQEGGALRCRARLGALTEQEKAVLKAHKGTILKALATTATTEDKPVAPAPAVTEPLSNRTDPPAPGSTQPFGQRELDAIKAGSGCWVWSGVLETWLFWVPDEERKTKAISKGIDPGCIWTLDELTGVQGMPPEGLRDIAQIKRKLDGTAQPGAKPARWGDALKPMEPEVAS